VDLSGILGSDKPDRQRELENQIQQMSERQESLSSQADALDSALQDLMEDLGTDLAEELRRHRDEMNEIKEMLEMTAPEHRVQELEQRLDSQSSKIDDIHNKGLLETLSELATQVRKTRDDMEGFRDRADELEERMKEIERRMEQVEGEFSVEVENRDFDFEKKLDRREFEDEKQETREEIAKLRASVNLLADEMNKKDELETE
jgi:chromosome segregation ATPase